MQRVQASVEAVVGGVSDVWFNGFLLGWLLGASAVNIGWLVTTLHGLRRK